MVETGTEFINLISALYKFLRSLESFCSIGGNLCSIGITDGNYSAAISRSLKVTATRSESVLTIAYIEYLLHPATTYLITSSLLQDRSPSIFPSAEPVKAIASIFGDLT